MKNNFWLVDGMDMIEHVLKIYHYNPNIIAIIPGECPKVLEELQSFNFPQTQIKLVEEITEYIPESNLFSKYNSYYLPKYFENRYRIDYGLGHASYYFQWRISVAPNERGMICQNAINSSRYQQRAPGKVAPILGSAKLDEWKIKSHVKTKPYILFLHTYDKEKWMEETYGKLNYRYAGYTNHDKIAKVLENFTDEFEVVNKSHHCNIEEFPGFTNYTSGLIDSLDLIENADLIVADYGGSAVESLATKGKLIFVDDPDPSSLDYSSIDVKIHTIFPHCQVNDLEKTIEEVLNTNDDKVVIKENLVKQYFPCMHSGAKNIAKYMEEN